jgi:cytochrome c peroxidase
MKLLLIVCISVFANSLQADNDLDEILQAIIKRAGLSAVEHPQGFNENLYKLGGTLFGDRILSGNKNISCMDCHSLKQGLGDGLPLALGEGHIFSQQGRKKARASILSRHTPNLFNIGARELNHMFWDGRVAYDEQAHEFYTPEVGLNGEHPKYSDITSVLTSALAAQALFPMADHAEMLGQKGSNDLASAKSRREAWRKIKDRVISYPRYQYLLQKAFPQQSSFNIGHIAEAIAHFQRHAFVVKDTPWDRYLRGDLKALSELEKQGALVFATKGRCINCHGGRLLGGTSFHNVVSPQIGPGLDVQNNDEGRFYVTRRDSDRYKFKTPMLRNLKYTAPYFHSGAFASIDQVIEHYVGGANAIDDYNSSWLANFEKFVYGERIFVETDSYKNFRKKETAHPLMRRKAIRLNEEEKRALKVFLLEALSQ